MIDKFAKKWLFIATIIVFSLIIGLRTNIVFFSFFFWFLVSVFVINIAWLLSQFFAARIVLTRKNISRVTEDDLLDIEVEIENNSFLPVFNSVLKDNFDGAAYSETEKLIFVDYVSAGSILELKYRYACPKRGKYRLGPITLYFFDPLGLFFLKKTYFLYAHVYVYTRTFNIIEFPALSRGILPWFGINTARARGDEDEFFGVREYREGDPIARIHWISSAKKNNLIVKQFQNQNYFRATIIFTLEKEKNFGTGKESVCEYMVKIAASISKYLTNRNISLEIIAHTGEIVHIPFNRGHEHLDDIFKFLAAAVPESRVSLRQIFEEFSRYISNETSLIIISLDEDWKDIPLILPLEKRNISIIPMILLSSTFMQGYKDSLQKDNLEHIYAGLPGVLNFKPLLFSCGENLEEVFTKK